MTSYSDARVSRFSEASTTTITGVPLDVEETASCSLKVVAARFSCAYA